MESRNDKYIWIEILDTWMREICPDVSAGESADMLGQRHSPRQASFFGYKYVCMVFQTIDCWWARSLSHRLRGCYRSILGQSTSGRADGRHHYSQIEASQCRHA